MQEEKESQLASEENEQSQVKKNESKQDEFIPEKSAEEYAQMWRKVSAEARAERKAKADYKAKLEALEKADLEKQGKYKQMWEKDRAELDALKNAAIKSAKAVFLKDSLIKEGLNPDYAEKALKFADLGSIEVDKETLKPDMEQIKFEAGKIKEELPMFFNKKYTNPKDGIPYSGKIEKSKAVKKMSEKELDDAFRNALKLL